MNIKDHFIKLTYKTSIREHLDSFHYSLSSCWQCATEWSEMNRRTR